LFSLEEVKHAVERDLSEARGEKKMLSLDYSLIKALYDQIDWDALYNEEMKRMSFKEVGNPEIDISKHSDRDKILEMLEKGGTTLIIYLDNRKCVFQWHKPFIPGYHPIRKNPTCTLQCDSTKLESCNKECDIKTIVPQMIEPMVKSRVFFKGVGQILRRLYKDGYLERKCS